MHRFYFLVVLVTFIGSTQADEAIVGSWSGTVTEPGIGQYIVELEINPGGQFGSSAFLYYPCGGDLSLLQTRDGQYLYQERLTFGVEKCMDGLQVRVTSISEDQVYFEELIDGCTPGVFGALYRRSR